jgi:hypothetical protein
MWLVGGQFGDLVVFVLSLGVGIKWEHSHLVNSLVHSGGLGVLPVYVSHRTFFSVP